MKNILKISYSIIFLLAGTLTVNSAEKVDLLKTDWSFKGLFGKFDRGSLQRGYQVYTEVCASCHSMKYVSYRNLFEPGGPEFTKDQAKAIAAGFEVTDGPNSDGEMFVRPAKLSDKFVMPFANVKVAQAANGGAYPPDMSVLAKANVNFRFRRKFSSSGSIIGVLRALTISTRVCDKSSATTVLFCANKTAFDKPTYPMPATAIFKAVVPFSTVFIAF